MTNQKQYSKYVDSFGDHSIPEYAPHNIERIAMDFVDPELHADGSYTLHLDVTDYVNAFPEEWYFDSEKVLEFHGDSEFLAINSREQAEEVARRIAYEANKNIHEHYIGNADRSPEEVIKQEYENKYGSKAPEFVVAFSGNVDIVDPEDLVKVWEVERDEDED